jgi:XTP/dITP diphosphohydrolase
VRTIVLATGNPGKLREIRQTLGDLPVQVLGLADLPAIDEPAEDGDTFAANARDKAAYYARATGHWCLADDSGLVVDALDGRPGVYSARYAAEDCPPGAGRDVVDAANNRKLLGELADVPDQERTARFVCALALADGDSILLEASGAVEGRIGYEPHGANGFGYDPLFRLSDRDITTAELPPEQKNAISHRGQATRQFAELLKELLTPE